MSCTIDHTDVDKFTKDVLLWWANNGKEFPTWALAMQIVGSFTPNSAAAERVFSMLKRMFGDMQMTALADMIQAALKCSRTTAARLAERSTRMPRKRMRRKDPPM